MLSGSAERVVLRAVFATVLLAVALVNVRANGATEPVPTPGPTWTEAHGQMRRVVEALRSEIEAMKRIAAAQAELMAWNEERARLGLAAVSLRPELCREAEIERWCRLLPATFGVREGGR